MGGMTSSSTTTSPNMPGYVEDFTKHLFNKADTAFQNGPYYYQGSTVTPFSQQTMAGMDGLMNLANSNAVGGGTSPAPAPTMGSSTSYNPGMNGSWQPNSSNTTAPGGTVTTPPTPGNVSTPPNPTPSPLPVAPPSGGNGGGSHGGGGSNGGGMGNFLQSVMNNGGLTGDQSAAKDQIWGLSENDLLNELINGNGLTSAQNRSYDSLQNTVYGNNREFQNRFNNGGFDQNQANAYRNLNNTVNSNNADFAKTFQNGGFDDAQKAAYERLQGVVNGNDTRLQQLFNDGGMTADMKLAMTGLKDTVLPNNARWQDMIEAGGLTGDQKSSQDFYRNRMNQSFDLASNPAYNSVRQNALDTQSDALTARAAAAGRYGSGTDQAVLAREQGNLANRMDDAEYRNWQNTTNQAAGNLYAGAQQGVNNQMNLGNMQQSSLQSVANLSQQGVNNQFNANAAQQAGQRSIADMGQIGQTNRLNINNAQQQGLNNITNMGQVGFGNQQAANSAQQAGLNNITNMGQVGVGNNANSIGLKSNLMQQIFNMDQTGLGNLGGAYQTAQMPYQTQMQVGQQYEDLYTRQMQDELRISDAQNPYNQIAQYMSLLSGAPTGQVTTTSPSWAQTGIGALLAGSAFF